MKSAQKLRATGVTAILMACAAMVTVSEYGVAMAQSVTRGQSRMNVPSQPLASALVAFSRQTGIQVFVTSTDASGKRSNTISGSLAPQVALTQLLAGTGLISTFTNANTVTIAAPGQIVVGSIPNGYTQLDPITVTGETATGPIKGIVAHRTATGSKTDALLVDVPSSVSVISDSEVNQRGATDLEQALSYTSGVNTDYYGADDRYDFFAIRGFTETGTGVYREGLPARTNSFTGGRVEPYGMQRIEVLKGSTSALYGMNAPGGLVNMITKRPLDHKFGEAYTTFGDRHLEFGTDFGGPIDENGDWSYRITAKWQEGNNGPDYTRDDRLYVAPALTWKPTDATTLTILADYNKRQGNNRYGIPLGSGIDPETFLGEPDYEKMDTVEKNIGYAFEHDFGNGLMFRSNARSTDIALSHESVYPNGTSSPANGRWSLAVEGELHRFAIDNHMQYDFSFNRFTSRTLFGTDYSRTRQTEYRVDGEFPGVGDLKNPVYCGRSCLTTGGFFSNTPFVNSQDGTGSEKTRGAYLQEELTFDDRWILTLGARYDDVASRFDNIQNTIFGVSTTVSDEIAVSAVTRRAGLTYKVSSDLSLYATYSESFSPILLFNGNGLVNPPKPMEGMLYEAGIKYQPSGMNALFTVAFFDLTQNNVPYPISAFQADQIGEINSRGVEIEGKAELGNRMNLTFAYSYLDAEIVNDGTQNNEGNRPQFMPEHTASLWADYTIPGNGSFGDLTLGLGARFVGNRYADNANTVKLEPYTIFDAALNYKITDNTSLSVNVHNLFDDVYINHIETFSNPDTAFYGDRRSITASLKRTW